MSNIKKHDPAISVPLLWINNDKNWPKKRTSYYKTNIVCHSNV